MPLFAISYDLNKPGQFYKPLYEALESMRAVRILDSEWLVRSSKTAVQIRDQIQQVVDTSDGLFVAAIDDWASINTVTSADDINNL